VSAKPKFWVTGNPEMADVAGRNAGEAMEAAIAGRPIAPSAPVAGSMQRPLGQRLSGLLTGPDPKLVRFAASLLGRSQ
jgi:hypothetical protein